MKIEFFGQTQASNNPLQYTGRENDGTGLYYYRNRYYSPSLRRFISRDPLGEAAGENEYSYVGNNPISFTDPLGLIQDGPVNYLRDPFPVEYWPANAAANTISDVLSLDEIAEAAWKLGNHCLPLSERLWAGTKIVGITAMNAFGGVIVGKAIKGLTAAVKHLRITRKLKAHVKRAADEVDAKGDNAFTRPQLRAIQRNPNLEPMFRGNRIDVRARRYAENDPYLSNLQSNYNRGPDFVDPATGRWWDMTTPGQWQKHVNKYGPGGTHLPTR